MPQANSDPLGVDIEDNDNEIDNKDDAIPEELPPGGPSGI